MNTENTLARLAFLAPALLSAALVGCDGAKAATKADDKGGDKAAQRSDDKGGDKSTTKASGGTKTVKLDKLKLSMDVETPEDPMVNDAGEMGIMVSSGKATVTVSAQKDTDPKTVEQEKSADDLFNPKNFKSEKLADGWLVTFDNTGSAGANYFLTMYRKIGPDKGVRCTTMLGDDAARQAAIAMCKGLKP
jgi:hypothetical protein